jgi:hypothetical protein
MEVMLLIWDELDDWAHACRHLATSAATEVADVVAPLATALLASAATFWGAFRGISPIDGA